MEIRECFNNVLLFHILSIIFCNSKPFCRSAISVSPTRSSSRMSTNSNARYKSRLFTKRGRQLYFTFSSPTSQRHSNVFATIDIFGCSYHFIWIQGSFYLLFLSPLYCWLGAPYSQLFFIRFEANLSENGSYSLHISMFRYIRKHHLFASFASYSLQNIRTDSHTTVRFGATNL